MCGKFRLVKDQSVESRLLEQEAAAGQKTLVVSILWKRNGDVGWMQTYALSHLQALAEFGSQLMDGRCKISYEVVRKNGVEHQRAVQMDRGFQKSLCSSGRAGR